MIDVNTLLKELYYNHALPSAYSSVNALTKAAKQYYPRITKKIVNRWLSSEPVFVIHKRKRKRFPRRKIITRKIDDLHQMDLMDVSTLARFNAGYRYLLVNIDCFSRFAWVLPLKRKTGEQVASALEKIYIKDNRIPDKNQSDRGGEFINYHVRLLFKKYGIQWYWVASSLKAAIAERFIRSFRLIMAKALYGKKKPRYLEMLPDLVNLYNSRIHRTIKMAPKMVNKDNESELWWKQYGKEFPRKLSFRFEPGDTVKKAVEKKLFEKEWTPSWSTQNYIIVYRKATRPPTYRLSDLQGNALSGSYYEEELQLQ